MAEGHHLLAKCYSRRVNFEARHPLCPKFVAQIVATISRNATTKLHSVERPHHHERLRCVESNRMPAVTCKVF